MYDILMCGFSKRNLKDIAIFTMFIDHLAICLNRCFDIGFLYYVLRCIGRISFPIFAFCLVDGFIKTKNENKYLLRLFILALVSEIPYNLFLSGKILDFNGLNVVFVYVFGFLCLYALKHLRVKSFLGYVFTILFFMIFVELFGVDYGACGILLISMFYLKPMLISKENMWVYFLVVAAFVFEFGVISIFMFIGLYMVYCYSGSKGYSDKLWKICDYAFYPIHLLFFALPLIT